MEIKELFNVIEKNLADINAEFGFTKKNENEDSITFSGSKGVYKVCFDSSSSIVSFECAYDVDSDEPEFNTLSRSLFDTESYTEKDAKSLSNEIKDELNTLFKTKKKVDLDKVKIPKSVSKSKAKNGIVSFDVDSLINRFSVLYPEYKSDIKANIAEYGEFLPETFFTQIGTPKIMDVIANGSKQEVEKLFKMLNEIYEDGTNEVQDIIGVTILGEMKNDKKMMETADKYMSDYMSGPVHEINKLTSKNKKLIKLLKNPPPYKPKKNRMVAMQNALSGEQYQNK